MNDLLNREWVTQANCRGVDPVTFFPPKGAGDLGAAARRVCSPCEVRGECLAYRMVTHASHGDDGIWGGTTHRERVAVARHLGLQRSPDDLSDDWRQFVDRVQEAVQVVRDAGLGRKTADSSPIAV